MKRPPLLVLPLLVFGLAGLTPAHASPAVVQPCADGAGLVFDIEAAAAVLLPPSKGKVARPAGLARARALAQELRPSGGNDPCTRPLDDTWQPVIDDIQAAIDNGGTDEARDLISYYLESVVFLDGTAPLAPVATSTAPATTPSGSSAVETTASKACTGFEKSTLSPPMEVSVGIELAELASAIGDSVVAAEAYSRAQGVMESWVESAAEGTAQSVGDWIGMAEASALMALDGDVISGLYDKAGDTAAASYREYSLLPCRFTKAKLDCFFKAAMAVRLLGVSDFSDERLDYDLESALATAQAIKAGKKPRCGTEKYAFRMRFTHTTESGQPAEFDTGRVVFTVKGGKITSSSRGPLIVSSVDDIGCWFDDGEGWIREGSGNLVGGRFPYRVSGSDNGTTLLLKLRHAGKVTVTWNGSEACRALGDMSGDLVNSFLDLLASGLELPAGAADYVGTQSGVEFHEPTGQILPWSLTFEYRLLEPTRR